MSSGVYDSARWRALQDEANAARPGIAKADPRERDAVYWEDTVRSVLNRLIDSAPC